MPAATVSARASSAAPLRQRGEARPDALEQDETHQGDVDGKRDHPRAHVHARGHPGALRRQGARGGVGHGGVGEAEPGAGQEAAGQQRQPARLRAGGGRAHQQDAGADGEQAERDDHARAVAQEQALRQGRRDGDILGPEHFGWFAAPHFEHRAGETLRLAATSPCCSVRDVAIQLLDRAGIPWTEVFVGGTAAISAALSAGLAVSAFPRRLAPADVIDVADALGLPPIPALALVLHSSLTDPRSKDALRAITAAFREHRRG
ncbi:hypothetical protein [Methylobacterium sp. WL64]|uniref:hypothetical protein n=1 Tax=Methylobacterium sp. WL64 TaxID=2603894 RepID=UPI001FEDEC1F|nr:hypothetical protein [Methylobacterium sp. WL64]